MNLLAELDGSGNALRSYLWGIDLSGDMISAGGTGGLLLVTDHVANPDTYQFPAYDGGGNVMALVNASDQSVSARYEYSPFGELIRATGDLAGDNPFRWSSKFWDDESGLVYYGYRYYSPILGRWLNRDPINEDGGMNIYGYAQNNPIIGYDTDGREYTLSGLSVSMAWGAGFGGFWGAVLAEKGHRWEGLLQGMAVGAAGAGVGYAAGAASSALFGGGEIATIFSGAIAGPADAFASSMLSYYLETGETPLTNTEGRSLMIGTMVMGGLMGAWGGRYDDEVLDIAIGFVSGNSSAAFEAYAKSAFRGFGAEKELIQDKIDDMDSQ